MSFGRAITDFTSNASNGARANLIVIGASNSGIEEIDKIYLFHASTGSTYTSVVNSDLTDIYDAFVASASAGIKFSFKENVLTIYTTHYTSSHKLNIIGKRKVLPINSLEDYLDLDPSDLELFINYLIRETSQIQGKQIPPSVERDITALERRT